jgi:hypothetical protein
VFALGWKFENKHRLKKIACAMDMHVQLIKLTARLVIPHRIYYMWALPI